MPSEGAILWKSDTQGSDEMIVAQTPGSSGNGWTARFLSSGRLPSLHFEVEAFRARIESFANRAVGENSPVSTEEVMFYLAGTDWEHNDLRL